MSFFVDCNVYNGGALDAITEASTLVKSSPAMSDRFDAIKDLREQYESLTTPKGNPFGVEQDYMRVASIPHTILDAALLLEPDLLTNKRKFYAWLDKHPEYCTYRRRKRWDTNSSVPAPLPA